METVVIGLTGGIACGKSTVARMLKNKGAVVIDADGEARNLMEAGSPTWKDVVAEFGPEILLPDNSIDRQYLGKLVFGDENARARLNSLTHPRLIELIAEKIQMLKEQGYSAIVLDAPLLFEAGAEQLVDFTWVVAVDEQIQLERLLARDSITMSQARQRIDAQMPLAEKKARGDVVIDNSGSCQETLESVNTLWDQYVERG